MKQKKTNAARRLDELKIAYRLMEYTVDEEHLDAVHVAAEVGMPAAQVFKTLVVRGDKTSWMAQVDQEAYHDELFLPVYRVTASWT